MVRVKSPSPYIHGAFYETIGQESSLLLSYQHFIQRIEFLSGVFLEVSQTVYKKEVLKG